MKKTKIIKSFIATFLLITIILPLINMDVLPRVAYAFGENWLTGWTYRKHHNITGSLGAGVDYPVEVTVVRGSGSDSGSVVYVGTNCLSNFADIRFTDDDGQSLLNAWNQTQYNGVNVTCRVEVADNLNTDQTIYIYYGNAGASAYWDGEATFSLFDDFSVAHWANKTITDSAWGSIAKNTTTNTYYMFCWNRTSGGGIVRYNSTDLINWNREEKCSEFLSGYTNPEVLKYLDGHTPYVYDNKVWMIVGEAHQLWYAPSLNGDWTYSNHVLITAGTPPAWDDNAISTSCFFYSENNSRCYIYYQGQNTTDSKWRIGFAISASENPNSTYTKSSNNPRLAPTLSWEASFTIDPVMRRWGDTYYLYYTGNSGGSCLNSYATASDLNGTWTKSEYNISPYGYSYPEVINHTDGYYYLEFDDLNGLTNSKHKRYLRSTNQTNFNEGITWIVNYEYSLSGGILDVDVGKNIRTVATWGKNYSVAFKANISSPIGGGNYDKFGAYGWNDGAPTTAPYEVVMQRSGYDELWALTTTLGYTNLSTPYLDNYHIYEIMRANKEQFFIDDTWQFNETTPSSASLQVWFWTQSASTKQKALIDWVFIRKYVDPEPSHGAWGTEETSGGPTPITLTIHKPENTTYATDTVPVNMSATGGTPDQYWFNVWNVSASAWVYPSNQSYTSPTSISGYINGTYIFNGHVNNTEGSSDHKNVTYSVAIPMSPTPTLTIIDPQNTTYTSGTIPVNLTATGGTIDTYLYNCWNVSASAWIYPSNLTYTSPTTMTSYVNGSFTFYAWVNNTVGNWDSDNVTFTVAIPWGGPTPDTSPPTYSNLGVSANQAGQPSTFSCRWTDNVDLSAIIFSTDNSGSWVNYSISVTGNPTDASKTITLTSTAGTIYYKWYANDTSDNWGETGTIPLLVVGTENPPIDTTGVFVLTIKTRYKGEPCSADVFIDNGIKGRTNPWGQTDFTLRLGKYVVTVSYGGANQTREIWLYNHETLEFDITEKASRGGASPLTAKTVLALIIVAIFVFFIALWIWKF